jgi:hypothetical protein
MERFNTSTVAAYADFQLVDPTLKTLVFNLCTAYDDLWREYAETQRKLGEIEAAMHASSNVPAKRKRG